MPSFAEVGDRKAAARLRFSSTITGERPKGDGAMSSVTVVPEFVGQAAGQLETIGSTITSANAAAAAPTTGVLAPAVDEVSAAITAVLGSHAQEFQAVSAQAARFHDQFVSLLNDGAASYVSTELANVQASGLA